ncbi:MAG: hypothetical protein IJT23_03070 [Clostridia bacterium]|nr:hypothetical protein [Clostridia bacterium]
MKKIYERPVAEIEKFAAEDILTTSTIDNLSEQLVKNGVEVQDITTVDAQSLFGE